MSNIVMAGGATGTGTVTLLAPVTSTNRTLTLPDSTGIVLNDQSDILTQTKTALNASNGAPIYAARAWVNFNGTGTVAIRASGNVSSITDNGTGDYTVNFTTAMSDANYTVCGQGSAVGTDGRTQLEGTTVRTASAYRVYSTNSAAAVTDGTYVNIAIFR